MKGLKQEHDQLLYLKKSTLVAKGLIDRGLGEGKRGAGLS